MNLLPSLSQMWTPSPRVMIAGEMSSPWRAKCPQRWRLALAAMSVVMVGSESMSVILCPNCIAV